MAPWILAALLAQAPAEPEQASEPLLIPLAVALVPGLLVHGAGHYAAGDSATANRLLLTEVVGLGAILAGGASLAFTGAARDVVGPSAALAIGGVGLFALSYLADIYGVVAPAGGFGPPLPTPRLGLSTGVTYVSTPQFHIGAVPYFAAETLLGRWHLDGFVELAPSSVSHRERARLGYRFWQPESGDRWLELVGGITRLDHRPGRFVAWTGEAQITSRLPMTYLSDTLHGAFVDVDLGAALRNVRYPNDTSGGETLLLVRFGFGVYVGDASQLLLYYDHRHDTWAAGLVIPGLGSGVAGHFGVRAQLGLTRAWQVVLEGQAGSAYVTTLGLALRWPQGDES